VLGLFQASELTPDSLEHVRAIAMARDPLLWAKAVSEAPPDSRARVELFLQLHEAANGAPFIL
jgi:hypothetical protein